MKALADELVRLGIWMQFVRQRQARVIFGAIQSAAVEIVKIAIGPGALVYDRFQLFANHR